MSELLTGLSVLVTRPERQALALSEALVQVGATVFQFPTIQIETWGHDRGLPRLRGYDQVIFVSPNAVWCGLDASDPPSLNGVIIAIGPGTQAALKPYGIKSILPDSPYHSESVLAMHSLQAIRGQRIAIVAGKGGRDTLLTELTSRGALVDKVEVYQRVKPNRESAALLPFWASGRRAIICTSVQSLLNLIEMVPERNHDALFSTPLVVVSNRIRERASAFTNTTVCCSVAEQDLINHLINEPRSFFVRAKTS